MPLRPAAIATTMLVASLASGMAFISRGYGGELGFDGTVLDGFDALLLWLMSTFLPLGLFTTFIFVPMVVLLENLGRRDFAPYLVAGAAAGAIPAALFGGNVPVDADSLTIFILPGAAAGLTWWYLAIERDHALSSSFDREA